MLQQSLLPAALPACPVWRSPRTTTPPPPTSSAATSTTCSPWTATRWAFFLGDVCGKGPQAAAVTSLTRYTLRAAALHDPDPVAVLTTLNTVLHQRYGGSDPRYCTVIFGILTPAGRHRHRPLASGGHPPALLLRADGTRRLPAHPRRPAHRRPARGALRHRPTTTLGAGDTLLLYTDGLTEARTGTDRTLYGDDALLDFASGLPRPARAR